MDVTNIDNQEFGVREKIEKIFVEKTEQENCCPVKDVLARFGDKWSIYTILMLGQHEKLRFNELKSLIAGVSQRMLTVTLRSLEEDGLVTRTVFPEIPPKVEYRLTELGNSLLLQLLELADWAKLNINQIMEAREKYASRNA